MQAIATLDAVPHLVRLLESKNEIIAEGASETMLHIVTPSEGNSNSHPGQTAVRAAGAIPSLLSVVCSRVTGMASQCLKMRINVNVNMFALK